MTGRVLHTGSLVALAEGSLYMAALLRLASDADIILAVPAGALAEAMISVGEDRYRLDLAVSVDVVNVVPLTLANAAEISDLCAKTGTRDLVAAHSVQLAAAHGWPIIASEADELALRALGQDIEIDLVP